MTNPSKVVVSRGDIWPVNFEPSIGQEIQKTRPAVVMNISAAWRMRLHIVVPVTMWQPRLASDFWMVHLMPDATNHLDKESAANAFQVKSVSKDRFTNKIGVLSPDKIDEIAVAIAICIGFPTKL